MWFSGRDTCVYASSVLHSDVLMAMALELPSILLRIPACSGVGRKREIHTYFVQSIVQESNGSGFYHPQFRYDENLWRVDLPY